jgi:hypothetical protein
MSGRSRLSEIESRVRPAANRVRTLSELDTLFRGGEVPDPLPDGFQRRTFVCTSIWGPLDAAFKRIGDLWMPWLGKSFDASTSTGINVLSASAQAPMRALWPSHRPRPAGDGNVEAFPFRNRVGVGEVDPDLKVYKIEYDFDANPSFVIRRVLDEVVQIDDGLLLGKILFRVGGGYRPIGYFALERPSVVAA